MNNLYLSDTLGIKAASIVPKSKLVVSNSTNSTMVNEAQLKRDKEAILK